MEEKLLCSHCGVLIEDDDYSLVNGESIIEAIVIFSCVIVNTIMGFIQEIKSENAIESLKTMTQSKAKVKRDGVWIETDTKNLVVGDIISLEAGDKIPADARIIKVVSAQVDESILTGESLAIEKQEEKPPTFSLFLNFFTFHQQIGV